MLVLSRRPNEKIVFPDSGVAVKILSVRGGQVRLGIDAPPSVRILREEVHERSGGSELKFDPLREFRHKVKNRLNSVAVGMELLRLQADAGTLQIGSAVLDRIDQEMRSLNDEVNSIQEPVKHSTQKSRNILVVEDDQNERELLAGLLRLAGFQVDTAVDGPDALDCLHHRQPDAVLLDMVMPRGNGWSTVQAIRKEHQFNAMKLFVVSGHLPQDLGIPETPTEINRWFHKPIDPKQLLRELQREMTIAA